MDISPFFFDKKIKPHFNEITQICDKHGYEAQIIIAYNQDTLESGYHGNMEFMIPAKLECLRPGLQKTLVCHENKKQNIPLVVNC